MRPRLRAHGQLRAGVMPPPPPPSHSPCCPAHATRLCCSGLNRPENSRCVVRPAAQTVFVRTNKNYIYRSGDEGKTWEKQNWKMEGSQTEEDGKTGVLSMHVAPSDTNKVRVCA